MDIYDRIEALLEAKKISAYRLSKETGISTGLLTQWKKRMQTPSADKLQLIAAYFDVTVDYLLGNAPKKAPILTNKNKRDIAKDLEQIMSDMEHSGSLMFDGNPMSDEAKESIMAAMKLGLEAAKLKNKERFTPKKHRKE